jgi:hypothetical protein
MLLVENHYFIKSDSHLEPLLIFWALIRSGSHSEDLSTAVLGLII